MSRTRWLSEPDYESIVARRVCEIFAIPLTEFLTLWHDGVLDELHDDPEWHAKMCRIEMLMTQAMRGVNPYASAPPKRSFPIQVTLRVGGRAAPLPYDLPGSEVPT